MSKMNDYIQQETITGIVPMTNKDRQYSFWDLFLSTSGFAIATWCYTQGAYVAQYLTFNQMLINIFSFNIIWVFIECLPILFAVKYGIDLWIWLRAVLGKMCIRDSYTYCCIDYCHRSVFPTGIRNGLSSRC